MANVLPRDKQIAALSALVEGNSIRSTERMLSVHRDTIMRLMVRVGIGCGYLMDETMVDLTGTRFELDEIWGYVGKKQRQVRETDDANRIGDTWTYVALEATTKLVPCFRVGKRNAENTEAFIADLASRLQERVQISTDGLKLYADTIPATFGGAVDYAQIVKEYAPEMAGPGRYSPPSVTSVEKIPVCGSPVEEHVSTSYIERQNLTMRMSMRRMTRLTNGFSKKLENHYAATALHFAHYNLVRRHQTLRCTPAMAAGVSRTMWGMDELFDAATAAYDAREVAQ